MKPLEVRAPEFFALESTAPKRVTKGYLPAGKPDEEANQRYTPPALLEWCAKTAGVSAFDLDVAACDEAHCAPLWIDRAEDGLAPATRWDGRRLWCNPPWDNIGPWVEKAWTTIAAHESVEVIAMLLPGNRQEQPWWQDLVEGVRDQMQPAALPDCVWNLGDLRVGRWPELRTYYPPKRRAFGVPGNPKGIGLNACPHPVVLLVWRRT